MRRSRPKRAGRAFELAGYRYDAIFRPLEQLLAPKEPPAAQEPPKTTGPRDKPPRPVISGTSAGFGRRLAALLYDSLLLAALLMIYTAIALSFHQGPGGR